MFHPFSQENPLQTGTGLGLAIVHSIVKSESVGGKVDVCSEEGSGTEIKVTFCAEPVESGYCSDMERFKFEGAAKPLTISLIGFSETHRGIRLFYNVIRTYLVSWWGFEIQPKDSPELGDIVILNDDPTPVVTATEARDISRPFIILSASRGNPEILSISSDYERIGGFCRIVYKPGGPSRLRSVLKLCLHALKIGEPEVSGSPPETEAEVHETWNKPGASHMSRRHSAESNWPREAFPIRPLMAVRSTTAHPGAQNWKTLTSTMERDEPVSPPDPSIPTVPVGSNGMLLRSSIGTIDTSERRFRVLVVEDNTILRNLLCVIF